jgi:hypothetical protein
MQMRLPALAALTAALVGAVALASSPASAAALIPVGSNLDFTGSVASIGSANVYDTSSTGLDFYTSGSPSVGTPGTLGMNDTTGGVFTAFSPLTCPAASDGGCGIIKDITSYNPGTSTVNTPSLPVSSFISFTNNGFTSTFNLSSLTVNQYQPVGSTAGELSLSGFGTMSFTGYLPSAAELTITAQGAGATSFSGTIVSEGVAAPEPASMLLLGAGLAGLAAVRRRTRRSA